ncbi:translation initiation factor [Thalassoglobus sp. JC818]|uniref:translation initiation factor n=1 Tax=Thalassoglobus sp. JC818 TaxID=3232136 RepID=UPI003459806A
MRLFEGTEFDRPPRCERCDELESECTCPEPEFEYTPPAKQIARIGVEKRKRGKSVTVIRDLIDEADHLPNLLTKLKDAIGVGGTVKDGTIELQGSHIERIKNELQSIGYRTKV